MIQLQRVSKAGAKHKFCLGKNPPSVHTRSGRVVVGGSVSAGVARGPDPIRVRRDWALEGGTSDNDGECCSSPTRQWLISKGMTPKGVNDP